MAIAMTDLSWIYGRDRIDPIPPRSVRRKRVFRRWVALMVVVGCVAAGAVGWWL